MCEYERLPLRDVGPGAVLLCECERRPLLGEGCEQRWLHLGQHEGEVGEGPKEDDLEMGRCGEMGR